MLPFHPDPNSDFQVAFKTPCSRSMIKINIQHQMLVDLRSSYTPSHATGKNTHFNLHIRGLNWSG